MDSYPTETSRLYTAYTTYNGKAESPAVLAESADGCFRDEEDEGGHNAEVEGRAQRGLSVGMASLFLLAEMAGAGVLNLPKAVSNTGWFGFILMMVLCLAVGFAGTRLGLCWVMLEQQWPEYRTPCRRPYPAIALRALGRPGQIITELSVGITLIGAATIYLLLASQMITTLLSPFLPTMTQCMWCLILGVVLCPTTWFSTPKDFWGAPVLAMTSTLLACVVVMVEVLIERNDHPRPIFNTPTFSSFFLGFGSILFALGGASIFPTIQNDMKNRAEFPDSVVRTFLVLLAIYMPVCAISYGFLGSNGVPDNILMSVSGPAVKVAQILILCHFLAAFPIVINPVNQGLESILNVPNERLGVKRMVVRTCVATIVVIIAFTIPDFGKIMDLVGGSTVTLMSFVFPPFCYLRLSGARGLDGMPQRVVPRWEKVVLLVVAVLGVTGGIASTWSALSTIINEESFATTCFSSQAFL